MSTTERIVDPYPAARKTMNATFESIVAATHVLQQPDLSAEQKRKLGEIVAAAAHSLLREVDQVQAS